MSCKYQAMSGRHRWETSLTFNQKRKSDCELVCFICILLAVQKQMSMKRRNFLQSVGVGFALPLMAKNFIRAPTADGLVRPKVLKAGDVVGLITPATYVPDPDRLALAERTLNYFGLRMRMGKNAGRRMNDYRISIDERLDDLHAMFRDQNVDAVFAIRGGYGSMHILDRIDYDLIHRNPKV